MVYVSQPSTLIAGFGTLMKDGVNSHQSGLIIGEWPLFHQAHPSALSKPRLTTVFKLVFSRSIHQLVTRFYPGMCMSRYNIHRIATQAATILQQPISHLKKSNKQLRVVLNDQCQQFLSHDCRGASFSHHNSHPSKASLMFLISFCVPDPKYFQIFIHWHEILSISQIKPLFSSFSWLVNSKFSSPLLSSSLFYCFFFLTPAMFLLELRV